MIAASSRRLRLRTVSPPSDQAEVREPTATGEKCKGVQGAGIATAALAWEIRATEAAATAETELVEKSLGDMQLLWYLPFFTAAFVIYSIGTFYSTK